MKELFYKFIKEASNGEVIIDNKIWNIAFSTIIYKDNKVKDSYYNDLNLSTLVIKDEEEFFKYLELYLEKEMKMDRNSIHSVDDTISSKIKLLISYLFINASTIDFNDPVSYLKRRIAFLEEDVFKNRSYINLKDTFLVDDNQQLYLKIDKVVQDVGMETPYRLDFSIVDMSGRYHKFFYLPSISYGICHENDYDCCYIYGIQDYHQNLHFDEDKNLSKKINELLYQNSKEITEEGISVLTFTIFLSLLKKKNIEHIKGVFYFPVKYVNTYYRNDDYKGNVTNKFIRTIKSVVQEFDGIDIKNVDTVGDGYVELKMNDKIYRADNSLLNNVSNNILGR